MGRKRGNPVGWHQDRKTTIIMVYSSMNLVEVGGNQHRESNWKRA